MIKAICFDLDGVYFTSDSFKSFKEKIVKLSDRKIDVDKIFHGDKMRDFKKGNLSETDFWNYVNKEIGRNYEVERYRELISASYMVNKEVVGFVKDVRNNGYVTCICSNNFITRVETLDKEFGFLDNFDVAVFSYEVGTLKPDKKIFEELVIRSSIDPGSIVYSDDDENKLSGANAIGINTFVYKDFLQFKREISKLSDNIV